MLKHTPVAVGLAAALLALLAPLPPNPTRAFQAMENAAHAPLFAGLAWLALRSWRAAQPRGGEREPLSRYLALWMLITLVGALTELAQRYTGRDASWADLANDALGAALALISMAARAGQPARMPVPARGLTTAALSLGLVLYAAPPLWSAAAYIQRWAQLPVLWQCCSPLRDYFVVPLIGPQYRGVVLEEPYADWRGYRTLVLELRNSSATPITVTVRVHDALHDWQFIDRYNQAFVLDAARTTRVEIALRDIAYAPRGRSMDLAHIAGVAAFRADGACAAEFRIEAIRLEP